MPRSKPISIEKRAQVEILSIEGYSECQIARILDIKMGCIIACSDMQKPVQMLTEKNLGGPE